jgi:hypothetical protein
MGTPSKQVRINKIGTVDAKRNHVRTVGLILPKIFLLKITSTAPRTVEARTNQNHMNGLYHSNFLGAGFKLPQMVKYQLKIENYKLKIFNIPL